MSEATLLAAADLGSLESGLTLTLCETKTAHIVQVSRWNKNDTSFSAILPTQLLVRDIFTKDGKLLLRETLGVRDHRKPNLLSPTQVKAILNRMYQEEFVRVPLSTGCVISGRKNRHSFGVMLSSLKPTQGSWLYVHFSEDLKRVDTDPGY